MTWPGTLARSANRWMAHDLGQIHPVSKPRFAGRRSDRRAGFARIARPDYRRFRRDFGFRRDFEGRATFF